MNNKQEQLPFQNGENQNFLQGLVCRWHSKKIEKMCLAFECKYSTRLVCSDCYLDLSKHNNHREQIIDFDKLIYESKQVMERLKYRGVEKKELKKLNEKEFDIIMEEIWNLLQEGLRYVLARGREAIRKLNEHIDAANSDDMNEIFGNISLMDGLENTNKNEIQKILESLQQYVQNGNDNTLEQNVNKYLQDMYRKQKLSREIIIPDLQKDIRQRLHGYSKEMLQACDNFILVNILENSNEIIKSEGISVQAPYKNETIRDINDLQIFINKCDQTVNSIYIQRKVTLQDNIEEAFHLIPNQITKIHYQLDMDSRNFFKKIKYLPSTVKMLEISGTKPNFDTFKLPKSIQNLKITLTQMVDLSKVIDGFIRYTPQKLQSLDFSFQNCQISKKQINHLIQSFKYLPSTLKTYMIQLRDNFLTPYSISKFILYLRYLPKSVHKVVVDVANQLGNGNMNVQMKQQYCVKFIYYNIPPSPFFLRIIYLMNTKEMKRYIINKYKNSFLSYEAPTNLFENLTKQDIFKKLNDEKLAKANLYYGVDQISLEYSFVRELSINLSFNQFDQQFIFLRAIIFKVFTNLTKFQLILNYCQIDNQKCEFVAKLILDMPTSVQTAEISINNNTFDQLGLQNILKAIEMKKNQLQHFVLNFENCRIAEENINIIKNFIIQQQIHLEIIC